MDADQAGTKNVYKVTGNHLDFCRVRLEVCFWKTDHILKCEAQLEVTKFIWKLVYPQGTGNRQELNPGSCVIRQRQMAVSCSLYTHC